MPPSTSEPFELFELLDRERRARRRLAAMSATKDAVLAIIADETRATLHCIADWMRLLGTEPFDVRTREYAFAAIERAARKELELLDDMLDLGGSGDEAEAAPQLVLAEMDVDAVLGRAVDAASRNDAGVRMECVGIGDDSALVLGDRERLERAFDRLLADCVRETRRGGTVTLALRRGQRSWSIRIEHPACPASSETDSTELARARTIVQAHRGTFDVTADGARGVRVVALSLPAADEERAPPSRPLDGVRVLVVEEDDECRTLLGDILGRNGATVWVASDSRTASTAIDTFEPHVVMCSFDEDSLRAAASDAALVVVRKAVSTAKPNETVPSTLDFPFTSPRVLRIVTEAVSSARANDH